MVKKIGFLIVAVITISVHTTAQDSSKVFFTTGVGVIKVNHSLRNVLKPTVAFNSGLEVVNKKHWFGQLTLDFNTLKYDQQVKDENSPYLFQNTNGSLIMIGLNAGRNFHLDSRWFISGYVGGGYLNIGEPRVVLRENIVTQDVIRKSHIFGRAGSRLAYRTPIKFLQTIYVDAERWGSAVKVQNSKLSGYSFFIGTRMSM